MKVFVYGSLKRGNWNHRFYLSDSEFICEAKTMDSNYDMVNLGSFPAMENEGRYYISGEVYEVNRRTLSKLDSLEGNGYFYTREKIGVFPTDEQTSAWFYAWAYIISSSHRAVSRLIPPDSFNTKSWSMEDVGKYQGDL